MSPVNFQGYGPVESNVIKLFSSQQLDQFRTETEQYELHQLCDREEFFMKTSKSSSIMYIRMSVNGNFNNNFRQRVAVCLGQYLIIFLDALRKVTEIPVKLSVV